ncbi:MAG: hypothetical protein AAGH89_17995, partial [Verrucomicrobiota bacterium]
MKNSFYPTSRATSSTLFSLLAATLLALSIGSALPAPQSEMQKLLSKGDANGDGAFSETELIQILNLQRTVIWNDLQAKAQELGHELPTAPSEDKAPSVEEGAAKIMSRLDRDKDGLLNKKQIEMALNMMRKRAESTFEKKF